MPSFAGIHASERPPRADTPLRHKPRDHDRQRAPQPCQTPSHRDSQRQATYIDAGSPQNPQLYDVSAAQPPARTPFITIAVVRECFSLDGDGREDGGSVQNHVRRPMEMDRPLTTCSSGRFLAGSLDAFRFLAGGLDAFPASRCIGLTQNKSWSESC